MKTIGLIGGLSPQSTLKYYEWLNDGVRDRRGGRHSARIILWSADFGQFCALKEAGDWQTQGEILAGAALTLETAGADFILMATNTMHKLAPVITERISVPFLHIADATAAKVKERGLNRIGLLGTKYSMEMDFYKDRLKDSGLDVLIPEAGERNDINRIIYDELVKGTVREPSRARYLDIMDNMKDRGVEGIILGCTEITLLLQDTGTSLPLFDTARIHVEAAIEKALH